MRVYERVRWRVLCACMMFVRVCVCAYACPCVCVCASTTHYIGGIHQYAPLQVGAQLVIAPGAIRLRTESVKGAAQAQAERIGYQVEHGEACRRSEHACV